MERETFSKTLNKFASVKFGSNCEVQGWTNAAMPGRHRAAYGYCSGNPVNMVDPTGLFDFFGMFSDIFSGIRQESIDFIDPNGSFLGEMSRREYDNGYSVFDLANQISTNGLTSEESTKMIGDMIVSNRFWDAATQNGWYPDLFDFGGFFQSTEGVWHARQDCLQQFGGYREFYDDVFNRFTSMEREKFEFESGGKEYVLWAWKGNYLNLGAGAEMGIYQRTLDIDALAGHGGREGPSIDLIDGNQKHWFVNRNLTLPMSLRLDYRGETIINYNDDMSQDFWWVTGFNSNYQGNHITRDTLRATFVQDFSQYPELFKDFYNEYQNSPGWKFDTDKYIGSFNF